MKDLVHSRLHALQDASESASKEIVETEDFCEDAPIRMSAYQLERFLLGEEPPVGRYHQACVEIRRRVIQIRAIVDFLRREERPEPKTDREVLELENKIQELNGLREELAILKQLAEKYKPLTDGKTYEQLQSRYWDERKSYDLAVALLCNRVDSGIVRDIMRLHETSMARRFLLAISSVQNEQDAKKLTHQAHMYLEEYDCFAKTNVKRPQLLPG